MRQVQQEAKAKINLFLSAGEKAANGYHPVDTVMQTVSLSDTVRIAKADSGIHLTLTGADLPADESNLAYRAAALFLQAFSVDSGVDIALHKEIPAGAGLGGGSADAAAVLRGLRALFDIPCDTQRLCEMGALLGADVPFCVRGGACRGEGIGERLTPCAPLPPCCVVIAKPNVGISTAAAYAAVDALVPVEMLSADGMLHALSEGKLHDICNHLYNRFEDAVYPNYPQIAALTDKLVAAGARGAIMTGSGSAVFGIFELSQERSARAVVDALRATGNFACLTAPAMSE